MIIAEHNKPGRFEHHGHTPQAPWPDDCYVQWGDDGIVFNSGPDSGIETLTGALLGDPQALEGAAELFSDSYTTAFFEAFCRHPDCFVRGEGKSIAEAEAQAWLQLDRILSCPGHEFERGRYRNGTGVCHRCGLRQKDVFEPLDHCSACGKPTAWMQDKSGAWWCKECEDQAPDELLGEMSLRARKRRQERRKASAGSGGKP